MQVNSSASLNLGLIQICYLLNVAKSRTRTKKGIMSHKI